MEYADGAIYVCSPRANGNSAFASGCVLAGAASAGRHPAVFALSRYHIQGCTGCQACADSPHCCPLDPADTPPDSIGSLVRPFFLSPVLVFIAPVYFYHFPAQFKSLMDRMQRYYLKKQAGHLGQKGKPAQMAYAIFLGARMKGAALFEGCVRSLRLMLDIFSIPLASPLLLRGLDGKDDLANAPALQDAIREYGRQAFLR